MAGDALVMGRTRTIVPPAMLDRARRLRPSTAWATIAKIIGYSEAVIRRAIDPEYADAKRGWTREQKRRKLNVQAPRATGIKDQVELRRRLAEVPDDTRSLTARTFDDPLPGRSALDRMRRP